MVTLTDMMRLVQLSTRGHNFGQGGGGQNMQTMPLFHCILTWTYYMYCCIVVQYPYPADFAFLLR